MKLDKYNRNGLIGTIVFHGILLLLFIFMGLTYKVPPPSEEGVEVNLGYSDQGTGQIQPIEPAAQQASAPKPKVSRDDYLTQKVEESEVISSKVLKTQPKTTPEEVKDPTPKIDPSKLYTGKKSTGGSEGITGKQGDQGVPGGNPNASNYSGNPGGGGSGIGFNLAGRSARSVPEPKYIAKEQGSIVVKIWVDQNGKVVKAQAGAKGTNIANIQQLEECERAAMRATFDVKADAPEEQVGTITYHFLKLN